MYRFLTATLLLTHAGLLLGSLRQNFVTVDEPGHFAAGICHWDTDTYGMYCVNPPLPRRLAVLPALLAQPVRDYQKLKDEPGYRAEWWVGRDFVAANAPRYFDLICLARLAGVAWSLLGGWLIGRWAKELYGGCAGLLALALWCFGPNVLAHAPLLTPDVPAAVAGLAATYAFWHYLRSPSWRLAVLTGLLLGVAELTKFTWLLLYGLWPVLWLADRWCRRRQFDRLPSWWGEGRQVMLILCLSVFVINLGYGFAGSCPRLGKVAFVSHRFAGQPSPHSSSAGGGTFGNRFQDSYLSSLVVPLPEDYIRGIDVQWRDFEAGWYSYLAGEWRDHGWWYYYLYALAVKVPLGVWGLVLWGLILTLIRHPASGAPADELALWLPTAAVLTVVSTQTGFNHHMRYVLPLFPFVVVSTGKLAFFFQTRRWPAGLLVLALLLGAVGSSLAVYPHSLSYFNEAAGGPANGQAHLLDSNLDWGQDLLFLKAWVKDHPEAEPLGLAYFNTVDPRTIGLKYHLPPRGPDGLSPDESVPVNDLGPQPGFYAVSVNYVQGMAFPAPDGEGGQKAVALQDYAYFRHFQPVARAGYSIWIYHISAEEANAIRLQRR